MKCISAWIIMFIAAFAIIPMSAAVAQEEKVIPMQDVGEITGRIERIDYDRSMILLKAYVDEKETKPVEYNIYVMKDAVIEKNGKLRKLSELFFGEMVTVEYLIAKNGEKEARHIWVKNE